jgi:hypothetical protein
MPRLNYRAVLSELGSASLTTLPKQAMFVRLPYDDGTLLNQIEVLIEDSCPAHTTLTRMNLAEAGRAVVESCADVDVGGPYLNVIDRCLCPSCVVRLANAEANEVVGLAALARTRVG